MSIEHHDDELVSAYLDGEVTPEEAERVADDPELLARVGEFEAIRDRIAGPVDGPDEEARDAMISRALAESATTSPVVTSLAPARENRRFSPNLVAIGSVAAAILVLLIVAPFVLDFDGDDDASLEIAADAPAPRDEAADETSDTAGAATLERAGGDDEAGAEGVPETFATEAEPAPQPEPEPAEEAAAEAAAPAAEADLTEEATEESAEDAAGDAAADEGDADVSLSLDLFLYDSVDDVAATLRLEIDGAQPAAFGDLDFNLQARFRDVLSTCAADLPELADTEILLARVGVIDGEPLLVVVVEGAGGPRLLVIEPGCEIRAVVDL